MCLFVCTERPTGFVEKDVYVFQSRYNEADKEIKRIKGLRVSGMLWTNQDGPQHIYPPPPPPSLKGLLYYGPIFEPLINLSINDFSMPL